MRVMSLRAYTCLLAHAHQRLHPAQQAYWSMWGGQTVEQVEQREKQAVSEAKARYEAYQASKNVPAQVGCRWRVGPVVMCARCVCLGLRQDVFFRCAGRPWPSYGYMTKA
jgi:hypothetical protein